MRPPSLRRMAALREELYSESGRSVNTKRQLRRCLCRRHLGVQRLDAALGLSGGDGAGQGSARLSACEGSVKPPQAKALRVWQPARKLMAACGARTSENAKGGGGDTARWAATPVGIYSAYLRNSLRREDGLHRRAVRFLLWLGEHNEGPPVGARRHQAVPGSARRGVRWRQFVARWRSRSTPASWRAKSC